MKDCFSSETIQKYNLVKLTWNHQNWISHEEIIDENGNQYEGDCINGNKHGKGICDYTNGDQYEGQWENNKRHGNGVYYYADGSKYSGEFQNGKANG